MATISLAVNNVVKSIVEPDVLIDLGIESKSGLTQFFDHLGAEFGH